MNSMFRFSKPSFNSPSERRFARLMMEQLETRDCPAIIALNPVVSAPDEIQVSGQITDSPTAGMHIQFSGAISGYAVTDEFGAFSFISDQATEGTIYAVGLDGEIEITNIANVEITVEEVEIFGNEAPQIFIDTVTNEALSWTFTGRVTDDESVDGLTVLFGGVLDGEYTTVNADGTFTFTCYLTEAQSQSAFVTALTTDWWGLDSNLAESYLA